jgi:dTMP kinase
MGLFITFEGIDGCGKSTQIKTLFNRLLDTGYPVILTREPGGTPISEKIRSIILDIDNEGMSNRCELLLYLAARAEHIDKKIVPEMKKGKIVLSDRFEEATFAYQGFGREVGLDIIMPLNNYATSGIIPDITFIFDITLEESEKRFIESGKSRDRIESGDKLFFKKIRRGYQDRAYMNPDRIILLNGELPRDVIADMVLKKVLQLIKDKNIIVEE